LSSGVSVHGLSGGWECKTTLQRQDDVCLVQQQTSGFRREDWGPPRMHAEESAVGRCAGAWERGQAPHRVHLVAQGRRPQPQTTKVNRSQSVKSTIISLQSQLSAHPKMARSVACALSWGHEGNHFQLLTLATRATTSRFGCSHLLHSSPGLSPHPPSHVRVRRACACVGTCIDHAGGGTLGTPLTPPTPPATPSPLHPRSAAQRRHRSRTMAGWTRLRSTLRARHRVTRSPVTPAR
jgi:hypothetical protein